MDKHHIYLSLAQSGNCMRHMTCPNAAFTCPRQFLCVCTHIASFSLIKYWNEALSNLVPEPKRSDKNKGNFYTRALCCFGICKQKKSENHYASMAMNQCTLKIMLYSSRHVSVFGYLGYIKPPPPLKSIKSEQCRLKIETECKELTGESDISFVYICLKSDFMMVTVPTVVL